MLDEYLTQLASELNAARVSLIDAEAQVSRARDQVSRLQGAILAIGEIKKRGDKQGLPEVLPDVTR